MWAWAQDPPCPWSAVTCAYAAEAGHLQVLQWARENGCPECFPSGNHFTHTRGYELA